MPEVSADIVMRERILIELLCRLWNVISANIFVIKIKPLLCIEDYCSKFPTVKKVGGLAADDLVQMTKIIFAEYGPPKMIISDAGKNFRSGMV